MNVRFSISVSYAIGNPLQTILDEVERCQIVWISFV